jgi:uncharacterized protein involved in tolerance to divalent cations
MGSTDRTYQHVLALCSTPEVIALPITGGSEKYLKWIGDNTKNAEVA